MGTDMARRLEHTVGSYGKIFLIGMLIGGICRLADYFPGDTLWSLSSIQTLLGFWVITNTLIVLFSTSHLCAGESSFLYMFGMTLSWNFYPSAFRGISVFAVRDAFPSLHSLRYGGVFSLRLEQGPRTQLHSVRTAGGGFGRGGGCPCHLPLKSSEILVPAPDGRRGYAGLRSLVLSKDQEQEALYIFALIASTLAFYALVYHRELAV